MIDLQKLKLRKRQRLTSLVGLALDGSRLEGVVLRRTNGSVQSQQAFVATLSLDPLTNDPELVGREIRNHLDAAGIRERHCVVAVPLKWALMTHTKLPELPEADIASFLQIEAERGFPSDVATLLLGTSQGQAPSGEKHATQVGIPRGHLTLLEKVLRAAQLKPVSFSLGLTALQFPGTEPSNGVLALVVGESHVGMQVTCGGGVVALRALEGALEIEGGERVLHPDLVAREVRITLGQLPADLRDTMRQVRVFGPRELAQELVEEIKARFEPMGLRVELVTSYAPHEYEVHLPPGAPVSAAFSLAAAQLAGRAPVFEFLPPKVTAWQQFTTRYSAGKLQRAAVVAGAVLLLLLGLFGVQQWQLFRLNSKWAEIGPTVGQLEDMQKQIRRFRPWSDESLPVLSILLQLTEAFPEDGSVSAKTVEIRDQNTVTCSGTARDNRALLRAVEKLRAVTKVSDVSVGQTRGRSPMQFTFSFHWGEGGKNER